MSGSSRGWNVSISVALLFCLSLGLSGCSWVSRQYVLQRFQKAEDDFLSGRYLLAAVRFDILRYRSYDPAIREKSFRYYTYCLYNNQLRDPVDTRNICKAYLEKHPEGPGKMEVQDQLNRMEAILAEQRDNHITTESLAAVDSLEALKKYESQYPHSWAVYLRKAELLMQQKNHYAEAQAAWMRSREIRSWLEEHHRTRDLFETRLNPAMRRKMENQEQMFSAINPLVIEDVETQISSTELIEEGFFAIHGMLRNQSRRYLEGVEVEVWLYNEEDEVVEVLSRPMGNFGPGSMRGFTFSTRQFGDFFSISHYKCFAVEP